MAEPRNPGQEEAAGATRRKSGIPLEERRRLRHESRTSQTYSAFLKYLRDMGKFPSHEAAEQAAQSVLCTLEQRIFGEEATDMEAQLPQKLRTLLVRCERHESGPPPEKFGRDQMLSRVQEDTGAPRENVEFMVRAVFSALQAQIDDGEIEEVGQQLPHDIRDLWARPV